MNHALMGMLLCAVILSSSSIVADINQTPDNETTELAFHQSSPCVSDSDLFRYYDRAHSTLMMATRTMYGYFLSPDNLEKINFHDRVSLSEEAISKISDGCPGATGQRKNLAGLERVYEEYDNMTRSADRFFSSPDLNLSGDRINRTSFGITVDEASKALHGLWISCRANGTITYRNEDKEQELYGQVFSSAVDAYAYLVLNDTTRRNASLEKLTDLDEQIDTCKKESPQWSCRELESGIDSLETDIKAIFEAFEKEGTVNTAAIQNLDYDITKMEKRYLYLTA